MPARKPPLQDIVARPREPRAPRSMSQPQSPPPAPRIMEERMSEPTPRMEPPRRMPPQDPPVRTMQSGNTTKKRGWFGITSLVIGLVILLLGVGALYFFAGAELTVVPKQATAFVDGTFPGVKTGASSSTPVGVLPYDVLTLQDTQTQNLPATGEENASVPASGHVVVYNNYSTAPQKLIKNTRFSTPEGLIFRIHDSISVPGQTTSGGTKVPGSVEVAVYADEAGEKYNIGLTDFTVPGFKGTPQYEGFYARSKTAMTGGFVGTRKTVSTTSLESAKVSIQDALRKKLTDESKSKIPEGYTMPAGGIFVTFDEPTQTSDGTNVVVSIQGTLHGIIVQTNDLAALIAKKNVPSYDDSPVVLKNPDGVSVSPVIDPATTDPWNSGTLNFAVKGTAEIEWSIDTTKLASDLAGKSENALNTILTGYPGIERARAVFRPVWRSSFPTKASDIKILFESATATKGD